jgi:Pyridoxamine 5'-phosphate oxidase
MTPSDVTEVLNRPASQELLKRDVTRLGYIATDGTPRCIPIGFTWNGTAIVMCTTPNAPKIAALRHNPAVALTIDTEVHPPHILLMRGRAPGRNDGPGRIRSDGEPRPRRRRG